MLECVDGENGMTLQFVIRSYIYYESTKLFENMTTRHHLYNEELSGFLPTAIIYGVPGENLNYEVCTLRKLIIGSCNNAIINNYQIIKVQLNS